MVVLPIDREKILLIILLTLIDSTRVHIFITSFRALVNNIVERFRVDRLEAIEWRYREYNSASIIVISINIAI